MSEDLRPPFRQQFDNARDPYTARNALGITSTGGGGPSSGAPDDAQYIVAATDPVLTNERVLTNTASITWDFTTPGQAKANTASGGGNVSNVGTPTLGQYAKWTTATTIQGVSAATVLGDIGAQPAGNYQPLDPDLTSLAAAAATNAIYYRSAANTWGPVTIGSNLTFTGGTLAATVPAQFITAVNSPLSVTGTTLSIDLSAYLTIAAAAAAYQPLDGDLTAIAALTGTNTIYYRSGTNTWSPVNVSTGLAFSGGNLTATATGGGNVSNSGTPTVDQLAVWTDATHVKGVDVATVVNKQGGILRWVSATALSFLPFNGDRIKINGTLYAIPTGGITGLANTGVFVDGVAGQNLVAGTRYWVYVFNNGGTLTADFCTVGHATSTTAGNVGTEIKSGNDTRTLIGLVQTNASTQFVDTPTQRLLRSWFNDPGLNGYRVWAGAASNASATFVETTSERLEHLTWANEGIQYFVTGPASINAVAVAYMLIGVDSVQSGQVVSTSIPVAAYVFSLAATLMLTNAEGYHYMGIFSRVSAGTGLFGPMIMQIHSNGING